MIRSMMQIKNYSLKALNGSIGTVSDFLFDSNLWVTRYLVADTGGWLTGQKALIPPILLDQPRWSDRILPVKLTKREIENSPPLDEHAPVSRQHETKLYKTWGTQPYWVGGAVGGVYPVPYTLEAQDDTNRESDEESDPSLRSANEVAKYSIAATDGDIGQVEDFLFDDDVWAIRYLVVDTKKWLPGKKVLIPLIWIKEITWADKAVTVDVDRDKIKSSPEFDPDRPINREQEEVLYDYYGRPRYWVHS